MSLPFSSHYLLIFVLILGAAPVLNAQSKRAYEKAGDRAFKGKDFTSAFNYYGNALTKAPDDTDILWKYAESAKVFYAFGTAEKAYRQIAKNEADAAQYPLVHFRLGELSQLQGNYTEAMRHYAKYREVQSNQEDYFWKKALREEASCAWALNQTGQTSEVKITHLDKKINSPYSDFAAFGRGDTLFFSSYRFEKREKENKKRISRLMMSINGRNAREPMGGIPAGDSAHVAHAAFSPTGDFLIFNYCKNINPNDIRCELWMVVKDIKGRWTKPVRLPEPINQKGFTSTQPSISVDDKTGGLTLWFASDRLGGKGSLDIWSVPLDTIWFCPCNKPLDARKPQRLPRFDTPKVVEGVNTPDNELSPFYHAPSNTFYFSSDGRNGFGGYDVYKRTKGLDTVPVNAGAGINTSYNDLYFSLKNDGKTGYLSSNRPGSFYLDERNKACCNDIYAVSLPQARQPIPATPLMPELEPAVTVKAVPEKEPIPVLPPVVVPPKVEDFVGLPLYFDNDEPDRRTRKTTTRKTYEETVLTYLERQEEYRLRRSEGLQGKAAEVAETDVDAFFDNEVRSGYERLGQLCELLLVRLQSGKPVEIVIKGFTSPRAQSDYNLSLGRRRISSVRNHMAAWSEGALLTYINNGMLRISETSFGETTARLGLSDDLKDERNSVYHPDAARERRVEIVEIK